jgi:hypothetical protein
LRNLCADEEGVWQVDLEAEGWDSDVDEVLPLMIKMIRSAENGDVEPKT